MRSLLTNTSLLQFAAAERHGVMLCVSMSKRLTCCILHACVYAAQGKASNTRQARSIQVHSLCQATQQLCTLACASLAEGRNPCRVAPARAFSTSSMMPQAFMCRSTVIYIKCPSFDACTCLCICMLIRNWLHLQCISQIALPIVD